MANIVNTGNVSEWKLAGTIPSGSSLTLPTDWSVIMTVSTVVYAGEFNGFTNFIFKEMLADNTAYLSVEGSRNTGCIIRLNESHTAVSLMNLMIDSDTSYTTSATVKVWYK